MISELEEMGFDEKSDTLIQVTIVVKGGRELTTSNIMQSLFNMTAGREDVKPRLTVTRPRM